MTSAAGSLEGTYAPSPGELPLKETRHWTIQVPRGARIDTYWIRGAKYAWREVEAISKFRRVTKFQLVPEPGNPWDHCAVAVYARRRRIGYIGQEDCEWLHQGIRAHNRRGRAILIGGLLQLKPEYKAELHFDGSEFTGWASAPGLVESSGLLEEVQRMTDAFIEDVGWDYLLSASDDEEVFRKLRALAHLAPSLTWPVHRTDRDPYFFVPGIVESHLSRRLSAFRHAQRQRAKEEQRKARLRAEEAKRQARAERENKVGIQKAQAQELLIGGHSIAATARTTGLSETTVSNLAKQLDIRPRTNPERKSNSELRADRVKTCLLAVELQQAGMSRAEVAQALNVASVDSVKTLLSDGKFYKEPTSYPERLARTLAMEASTDRSTRAQNHRRDLRILKELHPSLWQK